MQNKFRGKTEDGHWIYGGIAYYSSKASNRAYIVDERLNLIPVAPKTVGEATGYYDCNDNEIFEHDIVESKSGERALIYKVRGGYILGEPTLIEEAGLYDCFITETIPAEYKVIGNNFDNPKLLR